MRSFRFIYVAVVLFSSLLLSTAHAQVLAEFKTPGTFNYTVPAGVSSITIQAWGGGGGGQTSANATGGGGGGAFASSTIAVVPGEVYTMVVGAGGDPGNPGINTIFYLQSSPTNIIVRADAGLPGNGGRGGLVSNSIGQIRFAGGFGGTRGSSTGGGGGGGGSAFATGNGGTGSNGTTSSGGNGGVGAGNGGKGGNTAAATRSGANGVAPGGGGGGKGNGGAENIAGSGAPGMVTISIPTQVVYNDPDSLYTFTVPPGVTSISVQAWGAGGGGANNGSTTRAQSGGGGGAYASRSNIAVTPGETFQVRVGRGGSYGNNGGYSQFGPDTYSNRVRAAGGNAAMIRSTGGQGGSENSPNSIGTVVFRGGNGGDRQGDNGGGGGGGGSAFTNVAGSPGANGASNLGGDGGNGAGRGGKGGSNSNDLRPGNDGFFPGGGGGGRGSGQSSAFRSGAGADGQVTITWISAANYQARYLSLNAGSSLWCEGESRVVTLTVENGGSNTWDSNIKLYYWWSGETRGSRPSVASFNGITTGSSSSKTFTITTPAGTGNYTLNFDIRNENTGCWFSDNTGGCGPGNFLFTSPPISINLVPTANAGNNVISCSSSGPVNISSGSSASNVDFSIWATFNGSGIFVNQNSLDTAFYSPSNADTAARSVTLALIAVNGGCYDTSYKTLTITPAPVINLGPVTDACSNEEQINFATGTNGYNYNSIAWTSNGAGTMNNSASLNAATFAPSPADISSGSITFTITALGNPGCTDPVVLNKIISFTQEPDGSAGNNQTICSNGSNIIISPDATAFNYSGVLWETSGDGIFSDAITLNNAKYSPGSVDSTNGLVTLTLRIAGNGSCADKTFTKQLTIQPAPFVDAGIDQAVCADITNFSVGTSAASLQTGSVLWTTSGSGTFTNANNLSSAIYSPSLADKTAGTVILTLTGTGLGPCSTTSDTKTIFITSVPSATISYLADSVCNNTSLITATRVGTGGGIFTASPAGLSINATDGSVNPSSSTPGSYTITYTITPQGGCSIFSTSTNLTITALPNATITYVGNPFCRTISGQETVNINPSTRYKGGRFTATPIGLTLNDTSGRIRPSTSTPGTYQVTYNVPAVGGCPAVTSNTTPVTITQPPTANISYNGTPYCSNGGSATVTLTGQAGGTFSGSSTDLSINGISGLVNLSASLPGSYTVSYTLDAANGCSEVIRTAPIQIIKQPVTTFNYPTSVICSNSPNILPEYTGDGVAGTFSSSAGLVFVNSSTGEINVAASTPGTYTVTNFIPAASGCSAASSTFTITITALPKPGFQYVSTPFCQNGTNPVPAFVSGGVAGTFTSSPLLAINPSTGLVNLAASTPGTYTVTNTIAASGSCPQVEATSNITITPLPAPSISYTGAPFCNSISGEQTVSLGGTGAFIGGIYSISPLAGLDLNTSNGNITPLGATPGNYSVTYSLPAAGGCGLVQTSTNIEILAPGSITLTSAGTTNNQTVCINNEITNISYNIGGSATNAIVTGLPTGVSYGFNAGLLTISGEPSQSGTFNYTITASGSCAQVQAFGTIVVDANATLTLNSLPATVSQILCSGAAISPISYLTGGAVSGVIVTGLPTGVNYSYSDNTLTISGTPSTTGVFSYTVQTTGTCVNATMGGTIRVDNATPVQPGEITGFLGLCPPLSGVEYEVPADPASANYNWLLPTGWSITAGEGTHKITVALSGATSFGNNPLQVSAMNGCGTSSAQTKDIAVNDFAGVTIQPLLPICKGSNVPVYALFSGSAVNGTWQTNGDGYFIDPLAASTDYVPGTNDLLSGTVALSISSNQVGGGCPAGSDNVSVTLLPLPQAFIAEGVTICEGGSTSLVVSGTPNTTVSYTVNAGAPQTILLNASGTAIINTGVLNSTTIYKLTQVAYTSGAGCLQPISGQEAFITVNPLAIVNAGPNQVVCSNGSINLNGSISGGINTGTWSAPSGNLDNATQLNTSYTPAITSGSVVLTLTSDDPDGLGPCSAQTSTMIVSVNQAPTVQAGLPQVVCQGGIINLSGTRGGSATSTVWSAPTGSFSNTGSLVSTYTPSISNGNVLLTLTSNDPDGPGGPCTAATSNVLITVNEAAVVSAGSNQAICAGATVALSGSFGGGATSGVWTTSGNGNFNDAGLPDAIYAPSAADIASGNVTLSYTSNDPVGPCAAATSFITVSIGPIATVSAGTPQTICAGGVVNLNAILGGAATGGNWSAPAGTGVFGNANASATNFTPSIASGTVLLTFTTNDPAGSCDAVSSSVLLTVSPAPAIPTNPTSPVSGCGNVTFTKTGSAVPGIEWFWQATASGTSTASNANIGQVITNSTVTPFTATVYIRAFNPGTGCWSLGSGTKSAIVNPSIIAPPPITSNSPQCADAGVTLSRVASNPNIEYYWQTTPDGEETGAVNIAPTYKTANSGTYYLRTQSKSTFCWSEATSISITINPNPAIPANPATPIAGCSVDGTIINRNGAPGVNESWYWQSTSNGTSTLNGKPDTTVLASGTYYIRARNNITGCWSTGSGSVVATVNLTPAIPSNPSNNSPQCTLVTFTRNGAPPANTQWFWQTAADGTSTANNGATFDVTTPGIYYLRARTNDGCWSVSSSAANAIFRPLPDAPFIPTTNSPQCANTGVTITRASEPNLAVKWYWQGTNANGTDNTNNAGTYNASSSGTYYLRALDNTGCWSNASSPVTVVVNPLPAEPITTMNVTGNNNCEDTGTVVTRLSNPPGGIGWYWQQTSGDQVENSNLSTFVTRVPGTNYNVFLRAKNEATGCWSAGALASPAVSVRPNPLPEIVPNYCFGNGKVALNVKASAPIISYLWSPNIPDTNTNNQATYFVDVAETFTAEVTYQGGCKRSNFIQVSENLVVNPSFTLGNTGFTTAGYRYRADVSGNSELIPEGLYAVGTSGQNYHPNFWGIDHTRNTTGPQNMLIVNGWGNEYIVWEQKVKITPKTNYYFSAYGMSLNQVSPYGRLRFEINGQQAGTIGELGPGPANTAQANANNYWVRFYSQPLWNSDSLAVFPADSIITLRIINLEPALNGNDFAIDDISFGALSALPIQNIAVTVGSVITFCPGSSIKLIPTYTGGRAPYKFLWTGPDGFTSTDREPFIDSAENVNSGRYAVSVEDGFGCAPTTAISDSLIIRNPNIGAGQWTGLGKDKDWYNCLNWESGTIPISTTDVNLSSLGDEVIISPSSPFHNGAALARNLVVDRPLVMADVTSKLYVNGSITIDGPIGVVNATNGGEIHVLGAGWFNNKGATGFLPGTNSEVIFKGISSSEQSIFNASGKETFSSLTIDNQGPATYNVVANSAIDVTGNFNLVTGRLLTTETNLLTVTNPSPLSVTGGTNTSFVSGPMARNMNSTSPYYFPVGKLGAPYVNYRPVSVIPKNGNPMSFRSEYHNTEAPDMDLVGEFVTGATKKEWWEIERISGIDSARVMLNYITPTDPNHWSTTEPPNNQFAVGIVKHSGTGNGDGLWYFTDYFSADKSGFNLDPANPESVPWFSQSIPGIPVYSKFLNEFSPFTFAYAYYMILPIRLITFTGEIQNKQTLLKWTVADNNEVNRFIVEYSTDGNRFTRAGEVRKGNNAAYQFYHKDVAPGNNYYRLKMIGKDGSEKYSKVVLVTYGLITTINGIKPTLVKDYAYVSVESAKNQAIHVKMYDMGGRLIRTEKATLQTGVNTIPVFMLNLPSAFYYLTVLTDDGAQANFKVMRE